MELEVRNKNGETQVSFKGDFALAMMIKLSEIPELTKGTKNLRKENSTCFVNYITFTCIKDCYYYFGGIIGLFLKEGDYIKVIN